VRVMRAMAITGGLLAVVAGCGNAGNGTSVGVTAAQVYSTTVDANSANVISTYTLTTGVGRTYGILTESGSFSWLSQEGQMSLEDSVTGLGIAKGIQIVDGNTTYWKRTLNTRPPTIAGSVVSSGWTEMTWVGLVNSGPGLLSILNQGIIGGLGGGSGEPSPTVILNLLRADTTKVTDLGTQKLQGVVTTHYRGQIPLSKLGFTSRPALQLARQLLGTDFIGVDYWVESSRLLRQLHIAITIPKALSSAPTTTLPEDTMIATPGQSVRYPITVSVTLQVSNYGIPIRVSIPAPFQISEWESCTGSSDNFLCQETKDDFAG
jgi:hypothetical protein